MGEHDTKRSRTTITMTEQQIRAATIGTPNPVNGPISLVPYDPAWPELYDREANRIREVLGARVLRLEHIGSTAVPGLTAKPIIDILLVVADSGDEAAYATDLIAAGYILRIREPAFQEHRVFKGPDTDINLHVWSPDAHDVGRQLRFRDRLRTSDADRDLYAATKLRLAQQEWAYVQNYADAKTAVIDEILGRSETP